MTGPSVRRASVLMALAYATDLAIGQSSEFALRSCVLAMRIGRAAGLSTHELRNVYHQALLRYIGCNADTHLMAAALGDEIAFRRDFSLIDMGSREQVAGVVIAAIKRRLGVEAVPRATLEQGVGEAMQASLPILAGHCEVAQRIGGRLGLAPDICNNLGQLYERWDGHGLPNGLAGEAIAPAVRLVALAQDAIILSEAHGVDEAAKLVALRRGGAYEPALADLFAGAAEQLMEGIGAPVDHDELLKLEPEPHAMLDAAALDQAYLALADVADMRMPFTLGHSRAVADLAAAAGRNLGLPKAEVAALYRGGLAHDIGELAVPVATWMRAGPFTGIEADAARLHPYHGERIAGRIEGGAGIAALVSRHHERLDGSGYHRGAKGAELPLAARILAAAEAFQTAREPRPHRTALTSMAAANRLRAEAREGKFDLIALDAVLTAGGQATRRAPPSDHASLSRRETEVLALLVAGHTVKDVARELGIAPKTADNHVQSLYSKVGVKTRAAAVLYAVEHGLAGMAK